MKVDKGLYLLAVATAAALVPLMPSAQAALGSIQAGDVVEITA